MLHGSINHVAITVSNLREAMAFYAPLLELLGYAAGPIVHDDRSGHDLTFNLNETNDIAINIWQAEPGLAREPFEVYAPGLHHMAFNVERPEDVDRACELVKRLGAAILDGPREFPFDEGGYYAVYFLGPDGLKIEVVHMLLAEKRQRERRASPADSGGRPR